jgi:hypothetical protein
MTTVEPPELNDDADDGGEGIPPRGRCRLRLDSLDRVRREMAKLYRAAAYERTRDVNDASKLGHLLTMIARILEASDLERRVVALEQQARQDR